LSRCRVPLDRDPVIAVLPVKGEFGAPEAATGSYEDGVLVGLAKRGPGVVGVRIVLVTVEDDVKPIAPEDREEFAGVVHSVIPAAWFGKCRDEDRMVVDERDLDGLMHPSGVVSYPCGLALRLVFLSGRGCWS
jgi:hypothetical protein